MSGRERQLIHRTTSEAAGAKLRTDGNSIGCSIKPKILPVEVFWDVRQKMARFCVDCLVTSDAGVLMGFRTSWPLENQWCFVGGSIAVGDCRPIEKIVVDKVERETGLVVVVRKDAPIGNYSLVFECLKDNANVKARSITHDITLPVIADVVSGELKSDEQHSRFMWLRTLNDNVHLHPYPKQVLLDSGLFPNGEFCRYGVKGLFVMREQFSLE
jgi:ADP-ribose pyrophosphatase YjhB (NUDIX family)